MARNRDEFTQKTKQILANRVGVKCSNPDCRETIRKTIATARKNSHYGTYLHACDIC